jgi:hypothetical protein
LRHELISLEVHKDRSTLEDIEVPREDEVIFLSSLKTTWRFCTLEGGDVEEALEGAAGEWMTVRTSK